ncbi:MAG: hypothetical protein NT049_05685 [Planctomycetota bacterium]|nr:hypothetical protein [Planctomycetota bacterium]
MKLPAESIQEIIKGLEGLQMLSQWEQSLAQDLSVKAESLLRAVHEAPPAASPESPGSDDTP